MITRSSLTPCVGLGATLLLGGCPGEGPITVETAADSSSGEADSTTVDPDTGPSTTTVDPDTGSSTTTVDPETSTGPSNDCGNGAIDGNEVCDGEELGDATCVSQGFDEGTLGCRADCGDYDRSGCTSFSCGNGTMDPGETCDGGDLGGVTCRGEGFDSGTPGCAPDCSAINLGTCGTCGNVIVDGDEVCDGIVLFGQTCQSQGFSSGNLACNPDCLTYDTSGCIVCGNDVIDGVEPCDGPDLAGEDCQSQGFVGGTLACSAQCALDTSGCNSCGNELVDAGESCDGGNLGGQTCASIGLEGGELACTPGCQYDFSGCDIAGFPFGSDGFYSGFSLMPGVLPCDDISATGVATGLFDDDEVTVPIGFTLNIYGTPFTQVTITSNGVVHFDTPDFLPLGGVCPPSDTFSMADEYLLGVFWDDLDPSAAGDVYYQALGGPGTMRFVVQWDVPFFAGDNADLMRFQAMFHQSGNIDVCYVDTLNGANFGNNGADAGVGIQRDPLVGIGYSCAMPNVPSGLQLMYIPA